MFYDTPNGRKMIKTKSGLRILVIFNLLMFVAGWYLQLSMMAKQSLDYTKKFPLFKSCLLVGKARGSYPFSEAVIILKKP